MALLHPACQIIITSCNTQHIMECLAYTYDIMQHTTAPQGHTYSPLAFHCKPARRTRGYRRCMQCARRTVHLQNTTVLSGQFLRNDDLPRQAWDKHHQETLRTQKDKGPVFPRTTALHSPTVNVKHRNVLRLYQHSRSLVVNVRPLVA